MRFLTFCLGHHNPIQPVEKKSRWYLRADGTAIVIIGGRIQGGPAKVRPTYIFDGNI